jgi:uncharacterized membrane-anchored protein
MVLAKVFDKFAKSRPVTVIARATMERALDAPALDALFREHAESQYETELLFSSLVDLIGVVIQHGHGLATTHDVCRRWSPVESPGCPRRFD